MTRAVCRSLAQRGHQVRVLCVDYQGGSPYSIRTEFDGNVRIDRVSLPYFKQQDPDGWRVGLFSWRRHQRRVDKLVRELLAEWKPDLVGYNTVRQLGEQALKTISADGIPIVATLYEAWLICARLMLLRSPVTSECGGPSPLKCLNCMYSHYDGTQSRAMLKLPWRILKLGIYPAYRLWRRFSVRRVVTGAVAISEFMASVNRSLLKDVRHINPGIDLAGLPTTRPQRPRHPLRFGFVGGFQPTKGIDHILAAVRSLKESGLAFELHVWGPGTGEESARQSIQGMEEHVFLRGMYAFEDRWSVYGEIDVALMATKVCEPLGLVPLEAAATGAPTIASAVGGIVESIRDEVDGLLYAFMDAKDLERQMRRILTEPDLVQRLTANLQAVIDSRTAIVALEEYYYSVLGIADTPVVSGEGRPLASRERPVASCDELPRAPASAL
jgi:glycosyltransferase involved in cell wall biosynthesis